jgi:lipopolysaccharide export system protein LptA
MAKRIARIPAVVALSCAVVAAPALSERADREKPTQVEANRMVSDDARRVSIFEGNVILTKGTVLLRAERVVVRQDAEGFQIATATGNPVRFRQKGNPKGDREGVWIEGEARRIEIDDRNEKIELFDNVRMKRDEDEVRGNYVYLDQRSEFFSVNGGREGAPATQDGRVRAVIQPKIQPEDPKPAAPAPAAPQKR